MGNEIIKVEGFMYEAGGKSYDFTKRKEEITLSFLQESVGGYIQIAPLGDSGQSMIMNEEGKLQGLRINEKATAIFRRHNGGNDYIVGNALVLYSKDIV